MILKVTVKENLKQEVYLSPGNYNVFLSGGYGLSHRSKISFQVTDQITSEQQKMTSTPQIRCRVGGRRFVKLLRFEIVNKGNYTIRLNGITGLRVKRSALFLMNLFDKRSSVHMELIITNEF